MTFDEADRAYPYNPRARSELLTGVAKIACFDDPAMRRSVFEALQEAVRRPQRVRPDPRLAPASRAFLDTDDESERRFP